ncbi:MAG: polysaccharide deacetylase [Erysipelotrichaceae bacterium]|nr:polysaccharide deacetylase [Erysipelotrichaceae bacterium]
MEKKTGKTKRSIGLILIASLMGILIVVCGITGFILLKENTALKDKILRMDQLSDTQKTQLENRRSDLSKLEEEYRSYTDVAGQVVKTKEEFFDLASRLEKKIRNGESMVKIAYLTFDDGPYILSEKFLDVLEEYDVPATFFSLMKCAETGYAEQNGIYDRIYRRIIENGHTLGNHTASHKLGAEGIYQSLEVFMNDLLRNREFIYDRYGYTTTVMRFPGGTGTAYRIPEVKQAVIKEGYAYVDWNAMTGDGKSTLPPEEFAANVLNNTQGKDILVVLMHDYSRNTLIALPDIIEGLQKQGYIFLPLFHDSVTCISE